MWQIWQMSKTWSCRPSDILGIEKTDQAFFVDRGFWLFCSGIEGEMDDASNKAKTSSQARGARYGVLMKYLYPNDPSKRFRSPGSSSGAGEKNNDMVGGAGESFFAQRAGKRRDA